MSANWTGLQQGHRDVGGTTRSSSDVADTDGPLRLVPRGLGVRQSARTFELRRDLLARSDNTCAALGTTQQNLRTNLERP